MEPVWPLCEARRKGTATLALLIVKARKDELQSNDGASAGKSPLLAFRKVYVWGEPHTEGTHLPELAKVTGEAEIYLDRLREYVLAQGITLAYNESIALALGAAFDDTIGLLPGQTKSEELTTLVHELA